MYIMRALLKCATIPRLIRARTLYYIYTREKRDSAERKRNIIVNDCHVCLSGKRTISEYDQKKERKKEKENLKMERSRLRLPAGRNVVLRARFAVFSSCKKEKSAKDNEISSSSSSSSSLNRCSLSSLLLFLLLSPSSVAYQDRLVLYSRKRIQLFVNSHSFCSLSYIPSSLHDEAFVRQSITPLWP